MVTVLAILHVVFAVFLVGPMAILPMLALRPLRLGDAARVRSLARSTHLFTWLSLLAFLFGFGVMGAARIPFGRTWIWLSIVLYGLAFLVAVLALVPLLRRAGAGAPGPAPAGPAGRAAGGGRRGAVIGTSGVVSVLLLAVVVLMVWKP